MKRAVRGSLFALEILARALVTLVTVAASVVVAALVTTRVLARIFFPASPRRW